MNRSEYWIAFGGLLKKVGDWDEGLFLVTKERRTFSFTVRFTRELQRQWGVRSQREVLEIMKRYGYKAVKDELGEDNETDGYLIMLSSDTCLESGPDFLKSTKYDFPDSDMVRYIIETS